MEYHHSVTDLLCLSAADIVTTAFIFIDLHRR
jgi:hypothetical protein